MKDRLRAKLARRQEAAATMSHDSNEEAERVVQEYEAALEDQAQVPKESDAATHLAISERLSRCLEGKPQYRKQVNWEFTLTLRHSDYALCRVSAKCGMRRRGDPHINICLSIHGCRYR